MSYPAHLKELFSSELERWIARSLPFVVRRSLRNNLQGAWGKGPFDTLPHHGVILAPNHHSWWDGYLTWLAARRLGRTMSIIMHDWQLKRFPFFRHHGAISTREPREALRRLARGDLLVLFPEGDLQPAANVSVVKPGLAFFARSARAPIYPLALRVTVRGAQYPEALVSLGEPVAPDLDRDTINKTYLEAINSLLEGIDHDLQHSNPEAPPTGYQPWLEGQQSFHERVGWLAKIWKPS